MDQPFPEPFPRTLNSCVSNEASASALCIQIHFQRLRAAGVAATYSELDLAHLDFTFGIDRIAQEYVLRRLALV